MGIGGSRRVLTVGHRTDCELPQTSGKREEGHEGTSP